MRCKKIFIFILALFFCNISYSQFKSEFFNDINLEFNYNNGFLYAHHSSIAYLTQSYINGYDIKIGKSTNGEHLWEQLYRYPEIGVGFYNSNLGNSEAFGNVNAIYSYINIPILKNQKISFNYNFAIGIAYSPLCFNVIANYNNIAIGSKVNAYLNFDLDFKLKIINRLYLINGLGFTHFSNGAIKKPNLGLNLLTYKVGFKYFFKENKKEITHNKLTKPEHKNEYSIIFSGGVKQISPPGGKIYPISSASFNAYKYLNLKQKCGIGIDLFYDSSIDLLLKMNNNGTISDIENKRMDLYSTGIHLSHDFVFNKVFFTTQLGYYLYSEIDRDFYSRLGFKYKFSKFLLANVTLKTHWGRADFIEFGLGYFFN
ncbi:MAG: acyloxyacyl hydrolase [Bacteroidales bacterium]|nr:acyloxyacyl hydrolase [Bacteroidales bacterium]